MTQQEQEVWLEEELDRLIKHFRGERDRHQRAAVLLKGTTVSLAGLVTVLLGWKVTGIPVAGAQPPAILANLALVLGAMITVVSAYEAFFDPRALWIRETLVFAKLKDLQRAFAYERKGAGDTGLSEATLAEHRDQLQKILDDSLQRWARLRGIDETV